MAASPEPGCPLCHEDGGLLIARYGKFRIIRATGPDAADFPGFYRVVWNDHVAEFSDLAEADQLLCLRAVSAVERVFISSSNELGAWESGATAAFFGPVASVVGGGVGTLLVVALVVLGFPELRALGRLTDTE